jgi:hypothetical protein
MLLDPRALAGATISHKEIVMLTIHEPLSASASRGITRRSFFRLGALSLAGVTLGDVLRLRAGSASRGAQATPREKSVIMIHLSGGPSHIDMYDMKPQAPSAYRGEFRPIRTNVPGMDICEYMPRQAMIADKFAILRGVEFTHLHTANEFYSGFPWQESPRAPVPNEAQRPSLGSVVSRVRGHGSAIPRYVSLHNKPDWEQPYYAGLDHGPFRAGNDTYAEPLQNMSRPQGVSVPRLESRVELLRTFDNLRRDIDSTGTMAGMDAFQTRALHMVTSGRVRDAFDITREPEFVRRAYGYGQVDGGHHPGPALLQARRFIEAGVSVVTVCVFGAGPWDTHRDNFRVLRNLLPPLDQSLTALITDLDQRGLLPDVAVLMGGEFGRNPRIGDVTPDGRNHWPDAGFLWAAGGGWRTGQVIGATDARGERSIGTPIRMQNVLATLYRILGIDPAATINDFSGRPQSILNIHEPVSALC